jgi:glycosyltransferase involved in cell wall biosynthesis
VKILILIRVLSIGGAERQVAILARGLRKEGHSVKVAVFYGGGALEADLENADVPLINLDKKSRWDVFGFLGRLIRAVRRERPDVIYSFLPVANILTAFLIPFFPRIKMVWALCASNLDLAPYDWLVRATGRLEVWLAPLARVIISNSYSGRDYAINDGFPEAKIKVVPNGIDTLRFCPDREAGQKVRAEWEIGKNESLIGLVGRLDPMKGHACFLRAAALLHQKYPNARFVCVGEGPDTYRRSLLALTEELRLDDRIIWAGSRTDMPAVYNALDMAVSSSLYGEGLANMVGEAMACGIPCVVTQVGDSAWVVGETGIVVPPDNPEALADGIETLLRRIEKEGPELSRGVRQRIERNLSVESLVKNTLAEFEPPN